MTTDDTPAPFAFLRLVTSYQMYDPRPGDTIWYNPCTDRNTNTAHSPVKQKEASQ
jgi:hypothetical protein